MRAFSLRPFLKLVDADQRSRRILQTVTGVKIGQDVRAPTDYGTLRAYFRSGFELSAVDCGNTQATLYTDRAFIQFAGFTMGKTQSYFDIPGEKFSFAACPDARFDAPDAIAFRSAHSVGFRDEFLSRLNGWPMRSLPTLRSRGRQRTARGRCESASPSSQWTLHHLLLAGLPAHP